MAKSSNKYLFEKSVVLKSDLTRVFIFHLDTNNLPKISPRFPRASLKSITDVPLREGSEVVVSLDFILFNTDWKILIEKIDENKLIVDFQKKGLFEYWRHSHIFESLGDNVVMTDKIEYVPPFGRLGKLALPIINLQLKLMFHHRHKKTKRLFEN